MKKRLSLLMVLMMVLSLVPMSAFAASATVPNGTFSVDDTETTTEQVTVKLTQAEGTMIETTKAQAKLTLNKGEFDRTQPVTVKTKLDGDPTSITNAATVAFVDDDIAYLTIAEDANWTLNTQLEDDLFIYITFTVSLDEEDAGDVTLAVDEINDSNVSVSKAILIGVIEEGTADDMQMTVKDDTTKIGYDGGELSRVTISDIDEAGNDNETATKLELELPDYLNWVIDGTVGKTTVMSIGSQSVTLTAANLNDDKNMLTVELAGFDVTQDLIVTPYVDVDQRDASTGDLTLKVTARQNTTKLETVDEVIGALVDFDVTISAVEKGEKVIPALYGGDDATIKVTLDGVEGSFTAGRDIDFTIAGADIVASSFSYDSDFASEDFDLDGDNVDDGEFTLKVGTNPGDSIEFEMEINTDYATNGPVVLTAESRDFATLEVDVATVTPAYTVTVEKVTPIKKGEALATADIVIKEAKAGMFDTDQYLVLSLNDKNRNTMSFASDYKVDMTNGLDADDDLYDEEGNSKSDLNNLVLEITSSSSKEAGMITISDVLVSVDGAAVDGIKTLDTYLIDEQDDNGLATTDKDYVKVEDDATAVEYALDEDADLDTDYSVDYVNVVKEYGTVAVTTVFKIGSKAYTVNGEAMTANEAPFIAGKGYTMLPVRALAESLGLTANWNNATKTATFSSPAKIASVVIGADMMYVNGTPLTLNAKAEIKNGSTFIELRSIANAFGTELQWDAATKMVTIIG